MNCFKINYSRIENRLDPHPYHPIRQSSLNKIKNCEYNKFLFKEAASIKKKIIKNDNNVRYIGLESIESNSGDYLPSEQNKEEFGTAFMFKCGDVLFPKLRPYLNKVHFAEFDGCCSTEFHVLEALKCSNYYLFIYLNSDLVLRQTSFLMTGNTLPRLQTQDIENIQVIIPPVEVENRIVQIIKTGIEARKQKLQQAEELLNSIDEYVLSELGIQLPELKDETCFIVKASEVQNSRIDPHYYRPEFIKFYLRIKKDKFEVKTIGEITEKVTSGATPKSKGSAYTTQEEGIPFVRSGDINEDKNINFDEVLYIKPEIHNKLLKGSKLKKGDVLIAIVGATIGQVSIYDYEKEANINQAIALVRLNEVANSEYVKAFLLSSLGQKQLDRIKRPVARANINLDEIRSIKIILPSLSIQQKIAGEVSNRMDEAKQLQIEAEQVLEQAKNKAEKMILGE
jgi:type I restriction enzyme, S subunit